MRWQSSFWRSGVTIPFDLLLEVRVRKGQVRVIRRHRLSRKTSDRSSSCDA